MTKAKPQKQDSLEQVSASVRPSLKAAILRYAKSNKMTNSGAIHHLLSTHPSLEIKPE